MALGITLVVVGWFGVRWFYNVFNGKWVADSALEPIIAFAMIALGIIGLFRIF